MSKYTPRRRTGHQAPKFDYELFNGNNFNIRYWSWNYRGCWPSLVKIPGTNTPKRLCVTGTLAFSTLSGGSARSKSL